MNTVTIEMAGVEWRNLLQDAVMGIPSLITQAGKPVAEIKPVNVDRTKPVFGCAKGRISMTDDFDQPLDEFSEYM